MLLAAVHQIGAHVCMTRVQEYLLAVDGCHLHMLLSVNHRNSFAIRTTCTDACAAHDTDTVISSGVQSP